MLSMQKTKMHELKRLLWVTSNYRRNAKLLSPGNFHKGSQKEENKAFQKWQMWARKTSLYVLLRQSTQKRKQMKRVLSQYRNVFKRNKRFQKVKQDKGSNITNNTC